MLAIMAGRLPDQSYKINNIKLEKCIYYINLIVLNQNIKL